MRWRGRYIKSAIIKMDYDNDTVEGTIGSETQDIVKHDPEHPWKRYVNRNNGRYRFQMDLAISLINHGLSLDWKNPKTKNEPPDRPSYVRKKDWYPCGCPEKDGGQVRCFFCMNGLTHGITHKEKGAKRPTPSKSKRQCPKIRVSFKKGKVVQGRCGYCMAEVMKANPGMTQDDARKVKGVKQPTMGCDVCEEYVCKAHWHLHGE